VEKLKIFMVVISPQTTAKLASPSSYKMPLHNAFELRTTFAIQFYEQIDGCSVQVRDIPAVTYDEVGNLLSNLKTMQFFLQYVVSVIKKNIVWLNGQLYFDIQIRGVIPHYRDPDNYCYRQFVDRVAYLETLPGACFSNFDNRHVRFRFSNITVDVLKVASRQIFIPLEEGAGYIDVV
jgi:hypothetical protein